VHKWEFEPKDLGYEVTVEEWVLPDRDLTTILVGAQLRRSHIVVADCVDLELELRVCLPALADRLRTASGPPCRLVCHDERMMPGLGHPFPHT
jgi:hypothetical protein